MEEIVKLGEFDETRAKNEAVSFLSKSISTLSQIMGIDISSFDPTAENPYEQNSPFYASFNVLKQEVVALQKIMVGNNEQL
jgi:hypothetical protein